MEPQIFSNNPVVRAIITKTAPPQAQMAAAKGVLPLPPNDLLEILAFLSQDSDANLAQTAAETFKSQDKNNLLTAVASEDIAPSVLSFLAEATAQNNLFDAEIYEATVTNSKTPDSAIVQLATHLTDGSLLELITVNQQRLIRTPAILEAILANPNKTAVAERRARETRSEFFEKERGSQQIVEELRAQGKTAAAEFLATAEFAQDLAVETKGDRLSIEDAILLAQHIEVPDSEVDDSWLAFEFIEEIYEETEEQRRALVEKIISESILDNEAAPERIALIRKIMLMGIKDRVKLGMKGDREARSILIRDPNKVIAQAVLANARITDQEVEKIAAMRVVNGEILRSIGNNRAWARNYSIIHNLARNPRTPLATAMTLLNRIQTKDLKVISGNRNVAEGIRKQAMRLLATRK